MIKLKQEDYVLLHRIITGLNARSVWDMLGEGQTLADICEPLPDEFHAWVETIAGDLEDQFSNILAGATCEHADILSRLPEGWGRGDYAAIAKASSNRAWLFMLLDGKDPAPKIWRTLRPEGLVTPYGSRTEGDI